MRAALRAIVFLVSLNILLPAAAGAQANARVSDAVGFDVAWDHVALSVPNIAETIAWYEKMLGFKGTLRGAQQQHNGQNAAHRELRARENTRL